MNWALGHILNSRADVGAMLGETLEVPRGVLERYGTDSGPVTGEDEGLLRLDELVECIHMSQTMIDRHLADMNAREIEAMKKGDEKGGSLGEALFDRTFHDTYHAGQWELLRQRSGVVDRVI